MQQNPKTAGVKMPKDQFESTDFRFLKHYCSVVVSVAFCEFCNVGPKAVLNMKKALQLIEFSAWLAHYLIWGFKAQKTEQVCFDFGKHSWTDLADALTDAVAANGGDFIHHDL